MVDKSIGGGFGRERSSADSAPSLSRKKSLLRPAGAPNACRRASVTLRSTIDCLIAQVAIEHNLLIVHNDRDFDLLASVVPEVRLYSGSLGTPRPNTVHEPEARYG